HADRREAGDGVALVHPQLAGLAVEQEVAAGQPGGVNGLEARHREFSHLLGEALIKRGGDEKLGLVIEVFVLVRVELVTGDDLAGDGRNRVFVPQHADLDLPRADAPLDKQAAVVAGRLVQRVRKLLAVASLRHTDAAAEIGGLYKYREVQGGHDPFEHGFAVFLPFGAQNKLVG